MPGIVGIVGPGASASLITQMVRTMLHEKFYTSGTLRQDSAQLAVAWTSHPGAFDDCMPVWNETKDIALIFSGEHFVANGDISHLRANGHAIAAADASWLVHLYEERGAEFFRLLNGIFSGVIVDLRENKVVLFNDRYGLGRVYVHESADGFYFASEAKALLKAVPSLRQLDVTGLGEWFSCGCTLQNRTLFQGVSLLPPGSMWTFRPGQGLTKAAYFRAEEWENQPVLSEAEYYEKLKATFAAALPNYLRGPRRVAVSLTGGLDSRMIMAWSPASPFKLDTYTFGGPYRDSADVTIARAVARICQQRHHVIPLTQRFFSEFAGLAKRSVVFTDGALDITGSPGLWANRLARQIAPVRLTGNYGDEILRGHICFRPNPPSSALFDASFVPMITAASRTYANERQGRQLSFVAFKQMPWHHYACYALEQSQLTIRSPYLDNELVETVFQAPESLRASIDLALQIIAEGDRQLANVPTDRGHVARKGSFRSRILGFYRGFTTRAEYAYDYGMPQWLATADHSLSHLHLEHLFLGRHKYYHFRAWYRDQLAKFVENVLLDRRTLSRPYLNRNEVQRIVAAHVSGRENHTRALHKLISSEYIHRALLD